MSQILVVEDQTNLLRSILRTLNEAGFQTESAETLLDATRLMSSRLDLVVLDLMLPDGSGLEWLKMLRAAGNQIPVLILTARDSIEDRVAGLDTGADDYLVKPFALDELLARIRALLRRDTRGTEREFSFRDLTVDPVARTVFRGSRSITMQNRQLELLAYLISHANQIVTRDMIARDVWKESTATWTNVIEVQINQLRKKIEEPDLPGLLHTVRGEGYVLGDPP
ncbi:MAG TPA: DNA-binding response regulator [Planctomycetaceae bacterium]|uniref:response regulator transcription factor n=1 Tax=Gimesia maris TaxID=122 RepID=UPI000E8EFBB4|nr:DNA-binding response regulator [Planctomycetaceae bacterium]|tara:strand:+ start:7403 stop:8077 length:675 start_codon:yes stop_codon:yes gene_type:complete